MSTSLQGKKRRQPPKRTLAASGLERSGGHPLGVHRVVGSQVLPQEAAQLDASLPLFRNEILIAVKTLNIDAASFVQMESQCRGDDALIGKMVLETIQTRGKQHNPVTGSGGMLLGTVQQIGSRFPAGALRVGDSVATLVSLTLTPLAISRINAIRKKMHQIDVDGHAILFERTILAKLPNDLPAGVVLAAFDVAGAPASTYRQVRHGDIVIIFGAGGKAGLLSCVAARQKLGKSGCLIAIEPNPEACKDLKSLAVCDRIEQIDATSALEVYSRVAKITHGKMGKRVWNMASVGGTETATLLATAPEGEATFFSMATQFPRVALAAEGMAHRAKLVIGNGYVPGHSDYCIRLLRQNPKLYRVFCRRYLAPPSGR